MYEYEIVGNIQLNFEKQTPLHDAAFGGYLDCCELLLYYGADRTLQNVRNP
jgi:hypothetical protein